MPVTNAAASNHSDHRWINGPHGPYKWLATILKRLLILDKDATEIFRAHEPATKNHAPAKRLRNGPASGLGKTVGRWGGLSAERQVPP
jgi:hypothetical protein